MPTSARRVIGAFGIAVALLGIVVAIVGGWLAIRLGPSGQATFSATTLSSRGIVVPPDYVNAIDAPVEISARQAAGGPVWIGVAREGDAKVLLSQGAHSVVSALSFTAGTAELRSAGSGALADPSTADVWRLTSTGIRETDLVVAQGNGPESVVVASGDGSALRDVTVTVTWYRRTWFFEALVAAVVGAVASAFSLGYLWHHRPGAPHRDEIDDGDRDRDNDGSEDAGENDVNADDGDGDGSGDAGENDVTANEDGSRDAGENDVNADGEDGSRDAGENDVNAGQNADDEETPEPSQVRS